MNKTFALLVSVGLIFVIGLSGVLAVSYFRDASQEGDVRDIDSAVEVQVGAQAQQTEVVLTPEQEARVAMMQGFEDSLNDFLVQVGGEMRAYRQQRRLLDDLIEPLNLRDAAYIEENYRFAAVLIPALKVQMDKVFAVFEAKDAEVEGLLAGQPEAFRRKILAQWQQVKAQQGGRFVTYFEFEGEMLGAYEALLRFYYTRQNQVRFDEDAEIVFFEASEDRAREKVLRDAIAALKAGQAAALKG